MDAQCWQRIEDVFHAALELPEEKQEAFVVETCRDYPEIGGEVLDMLKQDKSGVSRLGRGVAGFVDNCFSETGAPPQFEPPEQIGPYVRKEFLGKGGMGSVWKYLRIDTGQPVAIKFLSLPMSDPHYEERRRRFREEISMLARLRHPNIVAFHDAGALGDGTQWFVMDYVEELSRGRGYAEYSCQPGRSMTERLRHFRIVCEAVLYAHRQGVLHRDLKPSNILVARDESPRIVDFGIARELPKEGETGNPTSPTSRFMSPDYAAPEWKRGGLANVATDVYALGVILYEVLAGRHPYRDPAQQATLFDEDKTFGLPEKPSAVAAREMAPGSREKLSRSDMRDLDKLCLKAMHPDPLERYPSIESLIRDIGHYLNEEPLDALPGMFLYRTGKFVRRNRQAVIATSAMLLLTVSLVAFFIWRLARERNIALAQAARVQHIQNFMTDLLQGGDQNAGPAANLSVQTMINRGIRQADTLGSAPEIQADLYETLGVMSQRMGRLDQADSLLVKALNQEQSLATVQPDSLASAQIALSLVRADEGRAKEAEQQIRRTLDAIKGDRSPNGALIGRAELALGKAMIQAGEQKQAIPVLDEAIRDITAANGPRSAELSQALSIEADADIYIGNYEAADALNRRALDVDRAIYGENHPHVADDLGNLAQTQELRDYHSQAEQLEREALAIEMRWYGADHPETARKMTTLAQTLNDEHRIAEANDLLTNALTILERTYGPDNDKVANVLNSMGYVAQEQERFDEAEQDYFRVASIYRHLFGDSDYRVAVALGNLASAYQKEKRYTEAEHVLEDVVQRFTRALGPSNIQTGMAQVRLGRNLLREQRYVEAAAHSLAGYNILVNQMSPDSAWVAGARHDLAIAYAKLGDSQKATQYASIPVVTKPNDR